MANALKPGAHILVTGAGGYIGGRLVSFLKAQGYAVRAATRETLNLTCPKSLAAACEGMQGVVHLAALNAGACAENPELAQRINVQGTQLLRQAADSAGALRFVYASTAHVYGAPLVGDVAEQTELPALETLHPYAATHLQAEAFAHTALRFSNIVGAPASKAANCWMLVANDACKQAVETGCITLRSSGLQHRDFVPMADALNAILFALQQGVKNVRGVFNVGAGASVSVHGLAQLVAQRAEALFGKPIKIQRPEPLADETETPLQFSTQKLQAAGFSFTGNLEAEIDATLKFCAQHA